VTKKAAPPKTVPTLGTVFSLDGKAPPAYQITLTQEEYACIGRVTVQWALLETSVHSVTEHLCSLGGRPLPPDISNFSFARRLRALREVAKDVLTDSDVKTKLLQQIQTIARLAGQRQRLTHHLWEYSPERPETLWTKSLRDPSERMEPFDAAKLYKLAMAIGEVTFALLNPGREKHTWAAELSDMADESGQIAFVSREFLLATRGTGARASGQHPVEPQARKGSRSRPKAKPKK
jgi:hypothetical protein